MLCVNTTCSVCQWHLKQTFPCWALCRSAAVSRPRANTDISCQQSSQEVIILARRVHSQQLPGTQSFSKEQAKHWTNTKLLIALRNSFSNPTHTCLTQFNHHHLKENTLFLVFKENTLQLIKPNQQNYSWINPLFWFNEFVAGKILEQLWIAPFV